MMLYFLLNLLVILLITVTKGTETYKIPIYIKTVVYPISPADVKGTMNELKYNLMMEKV